MVAVSLGAGVNVAMTAVALGSGVGVCKAVGEGGTGVSRIVATLQAPKNRMTKDGTSLRYMGVFPLLLTCNK